jgi:hypothetical protein
MSRSKTERHRNPRPRPLPRITEEEAAALILSRWQYADGTPIRAEQARHWAFLFHFHLRHEPTPAWMAPRTRRRPERPTAARLEEFLGLETDWVQRTPDTRPVRRRGEDQRSMSAETSPSEEPQP